MSNIPSSMKLFERNVSNNNNSQFIKEIEDKLEKIAQKRARIVAHNKNVAISRAAERSRAAEQARAAIEEQARAAKTNRIINRTLIVKNVNVF